MLLVDKSYLPNDEYDYVGSDSGSAGACALYFRFEDSVGRVDDSVGRVRGMGSVFFAPIGIESIGDIVPLVIFILDLL